MIWFSQNIEATAINKTDNNPVNNLEAPEAFTMQYESPPNPLVEFPATKDILTPQAVHPVAPDVLQFNVTEPTAPVKEKQTPFPTT